VRWPFAKPVSLARQGEKLAARYLRKRGCRILERNVRFGRYEIDLIARHRDTVIFVEVKTRRHDALVPPEQSVNAAKQRHIRAAAHQYIANRENVVSYYRFDVIAIRIPERGKPVIEHFEDAF